MPKEVKDKGSYFRLTVSQSVLLEKLAAAEERSKADVVRRALRLYADATLEDGPGRVALVWFRNLLDEERAAVQAYGNRLVARRGQPGSPTLRRTAGDSPRIAGKPDKARPRKRQDR